ncbi:MAG: BON domain-containing protein [Chloroflexota bacterium]|nr:BON domain-containing protein [Chloroflexota bacterium]
MSRLLALLVLVGLLVAGLYYWRQSDAGARTAATDSLGNVGDRIGEVGQSVGNRLRDTKVTGQVKAALELSRTLQPYSFDVTTDNEVVVLRGEVPTEELRLAAERVAASVPDVKQVRNEIRIGGNPAPADAGGRSVGESFDDRALEAKVNTAFSLNREIKGSDIKVSAFKREVTLTGTVTGEPQRQLALALARDTAGVTGVRDQIAGSPAAGGSTAAPAPGAESLSERARAAQAALAANKSLAGYGLTVREERGRLLLAGRVRTAAEKDLATLLARDAAGMPVENSVTIKP